MEILNRLEQFLAAPLHVGSHVVIKELVSKTELNQKRGFVVSQLEDRWGVVLFELDCEPGPRKIWSIKKANLKPIGAFLSLKVIPIIKSSSTHISIEPFISYQLNGERLGVEHAIKVTGWANPAFSGPFYSKYSPGPDLICYWNADDKTSPINPISSAIQDNVMVRGPAVFYRLGETALYSCPNQKIVSYEALDGDAQEIFKDPLPMPPEIGVEEIIDTLQYYQNTSFEAVHAVRFRKLMRKFSKTINENLRKQFNF